MNTNYTAPYIKVSIPNIQFLELVCALSELRTDCYLDDQIDPETGEKTEDFQNAIDAAIADATAILADHGITNAGI